MLDDLRDALAAEPDVTAAPSQFGHEEAFWVNGKEIAHFEADSVEIRVTRQEISAHRAELKADPAVQLRPSTSDWIELTLEGDGADAAARVLRWFRVAADRHRPAPGTLAKPAPTEAELRRRRNFH